jgi:hypothetical protein
MKEKPAFNLDTRIQYDDDAINTKKPSKKMNEKVCYLKFSINVPLERLQQKLDRFIAFLNEQVIF